MEFGMQFFPDVGPDQKSAERYFREALDLVSMADALNYTHIRIVEHYFHPYGGYSPNPIVFLAAAAVRIPAAQYRTWFGRLHAGLRTSMERTWGPPPGQLFVDRAASDDPDGDIEADFESGGFQIACPVVVVELLNSPPGATARLAVHKEAR